MPTAAMKLARHRSLDARSIAGSTFRRRLHTSPTSGSQARGGWGVAFDIDGVLRRGGDVLPEGKSALKLLSERRHPFLLLTNGGGYAEEERARRLSDDFGVQITAKQIIQSHTIFRQLVPLYAEEPILVVGGHGDRCRRIAEGYGFQHVYIPQDILAWNRSVWPFHKLSAEEKEWVRPAKFEEIRFAAVLVFHDPNDWGLATQITIDVLTGNGRMVLDPQAPSSSEDQAPESKENLQLPIYFSNPDLLWANEFARPRFGQGAFQEAVRANYLRVTGRPLDATVGGKPSKATYQYADRTLRSVMHALDRQDAAEVSKGEGEALLHDPEPSVPDAARPLERAYMIGDNPASDIAGANAFGNGWTSLLVRTGVFRGGDNDSQHPAHAVFPNVLDAVEWVLKKEGSS